MKRLRALAPMFIQRLLGLLIFRLALGGPLGPMARAYFLAYFVYLSVSVALIDRHNPQLFIKRSKPDKNLPVWEKLILYSYWPLHFFVFYYFAGRAYQEPGLISFIVGHLGFFLASLLSAKSLLDNPFFHSSASIQEGQQVIGTGGYSVVRHPGYLGIILGALAQGLLFTSVGARLILTLIIGLIILRTYLEDKMLLEGLEGYKSYSESTKYRLLPFIW